MKFFLYKIITLMLIISSNVYADVVRKIDISGNDRISDSTIIDVIDFKKSNNYSNSDLNNFQKKLFETNFFSDVKLKLEDDILKISVTENPLIEFFIIEGVINKTREDKIYELLNLGNNKIFSENFLQQDISIIKSLYKDAGYIDVTVTPKLSLLPNNTLNVVLNVSRGEKLNVRRVFFIGDKYFDSSTLSDVVSTTEYGWWKFLSNSSSLNNQRIEYDKSLLKNFYLNEGFYDVQILSSDINLSGKTSVSITFSINSGSRYNFSDLAILDDQKNLSQNDIKIIEKLGVKRLKGFFSLKKIENFKDDIYRYLTQKKIDFIDYDIDFIKNNNQTISSKIFFKKSPSKSVNLIEVKGNSITEEEVVRRNIILSDGDSLTEYKLKKSLDNLRSTGIFKSVNYEEKLINNEKINLEIKVEEQPTGSISAGVGVGSSGSNIGTGIGEKNLFGKGITLNSNLSLGTEKIQGNVNLTIPDFKNTDNSFTNNFYIVSSDLENAGYESTIAGNISSIEYDIFEDVRFGFGGGIERDKITTNSSASQLYKSREGNYLTYKGFYNIINDKRDKKFQTTKGYKTEINQTLALPGSDIPFIENNVSGQIYYPISKQHTFSVKSGLSSINSFNNKDVKLSDRQFLTNKKLRGFENFGVGPKDGKDHVGGNYSAYANFSSTVPNAIPDKWNAKSIVFLDIGNVWGVDYDSSLDSDKIRSSIGLGLDWTSPIGPLSFVFAQPISSASSDKKESFSFQIGSSF